MRYAAQVIAVLLLAGCASAPPKVEIVTVTVERIVPVPERLTRPCERFVPQSQTNFEAKRLAIVRDDAAAACNVRMAEIRALGKSP